MLPVAIVSISMLHFSLDQRRFMVYELPQNFYSFSARRTFLSVIVIVFLTLLFISLVAIVCTFIVEDNLIFPCTQKSMSDKKVDAPPDRVIPDL